MCQGLRPTGARTRHWGLDVFSAAAPLQWAYLWANQPSAASYTPDLVYQRNSSGATNWVTRTSVGVYAVHLPNLGGFDVISQRTDGSGTVHVTAYGSGTQICKVTGWGPGPPLWSDLAQHIGVQCFDSSGARADTEFTLSYANANIPNRTPDADMAYLWADQWSAASYTPALHRQFNSSGATNTVRRTGIGAYTASLPNLGTPAGGHVQVTAYGTRSDRCNVKIWPSPLGSTQEVQVRCFSGGTPVDTRFTLT